MKRLGQKPEALYISSACYSDNTNLMLKELRERIDRSRETAINSLNIDVFPKTIVDMLLEEQRKLEEQHAKEMLYSVPKYVISGDYIPFEWLKYNPNLGLTQHFTDKPRLKDLYFKYIQPYETNAICKLEKEKENMEAKKCERCGKLYEAQDADPYIPVYFPGLPVSDWSKENFSESRIRKDNTRIISVNFRGGEIIDLCPECRQKLKNFFESGKDETTVIKKAEEN